MQRGQTGPFWYGFVTETVLEMEMEGEGIKKTWELGGTPGEIRTPDPLLRRQVLYPAELRAHSRYAAHPALYTFGLTSVKAANREVLKVTNKEPSSHLEM